MIEWVLISKIWSLLDLTNRWIKPKTKFFFSPTELWFDHEDTDNEDLESGFVSLESMGQFINEKGMTLMSIWRINGCKVYVVFFYAFDLY